LFVLARVFGVLAFAVTFHCVEFKQILQMKISFLE